MGSDIFGGGTVAEEGREGVDGFGFFNIGYVGREIFDDAAKFVTGDSWGAAFTVLLGISGPPLEFVARSTDTRARTSASPGYNVGIAASSKTTCSGPPVA